MHTCSSVVSWPAWCHAHRPQAATQATTPAWSGPLLTAGISWGQVGGELLFDTALMQAAGEQNKCTASATALPLHCASHWSSAPENRRHPADAQHNSLSCSTSPTHQQAVVPAPFAEVQQLNWT